MKTYKGFKDYFGEDFKKRKSMRDKIARIWENYAYDSYETPTVEFKSLYLKKSSEELVNKQSFQLKGDKELMLRPEVTPSLGRYLSANRAFVSAPLRLYSMMPMFRFENPQKGRLREFYQYNLDFVYQDRKMALSEMISIIKQSFKALSIEDYEIRLSNREWLEEIIALMGLKNTQKLLKSIDRSEGDLFSSLYEINSFDKLIDYLEKNKISKKKLQKIKEYKSIFSEDKVVLSLTTVRGLDYYKGFVFEVFSKDTSKMTRALGGGGEYDLVGQYGGDSLPMIGFALGEVPLMELYSMEEDEYEESYLLASDDVVEDVIFLEKLREDFIKDKRVVFIDKSLKIKKAFNSAKKYKSRYLIYRGAREREEGSYIIKDLKLREQKTIYID